MESSNIAGIVKKKLAVYDWRVAREVPRWVHGKWWRASS